MATKVAATTAMALASRASRACDVCASKSARWYCGADAAFLCDRCDTQVHTANSLAQRHERVRLTPSGAPSKLTTSRPPTETSKAKKPTNKKKITHSPPPQMLPARKRTRTSRPHPHRPRRAEEEEEEEEDVEEEVTVHVKVEDSANLFAHFFDTEDFLIDHPQEVPSCSELNLSHSECSEPSSSSLQSPGSSAEDCFSPGGESTFHGVSSDDSSFAAYFKGKAALTEDVVIQSSDEFEALVPTGIDIICCDADGNISLAGDACFIPGDIPGLDAFDDCSLSFDLAASGAFEGEHAAAGGILTSKNVETDHYATGPFAKYFVTKKASSSSSSSSSPEIIKSEAREILRCCTEGETADQRPTLRLNYEEIIAAWSDRGEPWVNPECNAATDVGIVPDLGLPTSEDHEGADDGSSREARVMRYKDKRRSRLFSKTIRYEVRKLNAERRPRLKGRFVKRTSCDIS